ncbi:MAG: biotin--[acetyl-CoA-carboxylase] ligase [Desulfovibrionaceae bacterium]
MVYNKATEKQGGAAASCRRQRILALLEQGGGWCSGEAISLELGISRAAVAKHVACLRAEGHGIESSPRRGYRLAVKADALTGERVAPLLATRVVGRQAWRCLESTTTTNREAIVWAAEGAASGCVVIAEHQTEGRGKKGRRWFSAPRGIHCSVIVRGRFDAGVRPLLTTVGTVAVAEAIGRCTALSPVVKYPNDVLVNGRKVCGVLVEFGLIDEEVDWAIVGMGCNVNATTADFPEELRHVTSSLFIEGGVPVARPELLAVILERTEHWCDALLDKACDGLLARWEELGGGPLPVPC